MLVQLAYPRHPLQTVGYAPTSLSLVVIFISSHVLDRRHVRSINQYRSCSIRINRRFDRSRVGLGYRTSLIRRPYKDNMAKP